MSDQLERLKEALADRYAIEREIGAGGMATVYLARDLKHGRQVAVKVLRPDLARALGSERFLREIEIAARLQHPHILPLHDSGEADGFLFYVMPYVDGESLRAKIDREKELDVPDAIRILREVVDALSHAHGQGVVHRDIKPDNVLLSGNHAVVTDFGVAKAVSEATGRHEVTTAGVALGTPTYMAPEQASAEPTIDHRADIYAIGALAYELLAGRPPFVGPTAQSVLAAHVIETPDPVTTHRTVSPALGAVVMKCLEKRPDDRWQSAADLLPELEALATPSGGVAPTQAVAGTNRAPAGRSWRRPAAGAAVGVLVVAWALRGFLPGAASGEDGGDQRSLAVLPFVNTSGDPENEPFTNGIHDDILSQLSKIGDLKVISRTSVMEYRNTPKNAREIGEELGVGALLEGGVQRSGDMVRINATLVDARSDEQLWSEIYNRELTVENVFAIQGEIAEQIAIALRATLSPGEKEQIGARPTGNLEAYETYLRGQEYYRRGYEEPDLRIAEQMFTRATILDPEFALAWAHLSEVHGYLWWFFYDRTDERVELARTTAEEALRLGPDLAEAHQAMGQYRYRRLDFEGALREFEIARTLDPGAGEIFSRIAYVQRRQGLLAEAVENLQQAVEFDPRWAVLIGETADTYARMRNVDEAVRFYDRAIDLSPDFREPHWGKARRIRIRVEGDAAAARSAVQAARAAGARDPNFDFVLAEADLLDGQYQRALDLLDDVGLDAFETQHFYRPLSLLSAQLYELLGDEERAEASYRAAQAAVEANLRESPDDERYYSALGLIYAGRGMREEALAAGERATELMPLTADWFRGFYRAEDLVRIQAKLGETDAALEGLEYLMSIHGDLGAGYLAADPTWGALRDHPRFQALVRDAG